MLLLCVGICLPSFNVFICHKKSSGKDFADHLKNGLEELGYHSFLDSKDIPKIVDGDGWREIRDRALKESKIVIIILTPGLTLSQEVINEFAMAREMHKKFLFFRPRELGRKFVFNLPNEYLDLSEKEQVSFETKEELLRLAHGILLKFDPESHMPEQRSASQVVKISLKDENIPKTDLATCAMCNKPIVDQLVRESINEKIYSFDCADCAKNFKKLRSIYGPDFQ
jgi:hypothetical protein